MHLGLAVSGLLHSVGHVVGGAVHSSGQPVSQRAGHGHVGLRAHQPGAVAGFWHSVGQGCSQLQTGSGVTNETQ